jgi:hypothetical protein
MNLAKGAAMAVNVCPAAVTTATVDEVWSLLADPALYGEWWDATTTSIEPAGLAQAGQIIHAETRALLRRWKVTLTVEEVDPIKHRLRFTTKLPLGIIGHNVIDCLPWTPDPAVQSAAEIATGACLIRFG